MQRSSYALSSRLIVTSGKRGGRSATLVWTSFRNMCASAGKRLRKPVEVLQCVEFIGDFWYSSRIPAMPASVRNTLCGRCYGPCSVTCAVCSVSFFHVHASARARMRQRRGLSKPGPAPEPWSGTCAPRPIYNPGVSLRAPISSRPGNERAGVPAPSHVPPIHRVERKAPYADCLRSSVAPAQRCAIALFPAHVGRASRLGLEPGRPAGACGTRGG